ncbi:glycine zipper family protein [Polynucleobacter sp. CS-Odin-A6]|uniref:glycine zipper family protein n=1 Tax=Polynucleobacter sp. CS-Odin-A6 TaxID=2689106 RepID=UPI001C0D03EE|nr:glycine zipper family protein [Polynucleobacter sp. CS-Odin-A6]MBU3620831.1 glycine zipper family protein [Polynucleobacter sp. CS-Odin-A6]
MKRAVLTLIAVSSLAACVSAPTGPTIAIMPREGKPFEVFQQEDQQCREFAANAIKDTSNAALKEGATSALIAAALGAAAGAVIQGGSGQNIGTGAGIGLLGGAGIGAMNASGKQNQGQVQYNIAYQQCMYSKGNQVPSYPTQSNSSYMPPQGKPAMPSNGSKPIQ